MYNIRMVFTILADPTERNTRPQKPLHHEKQKKGDKGEGLCDPSMGTLTPG